MSRAPLGNVLLETLRTLFIAACKLIMIALGWALRISGLILQKIGDAIIQLTTR